MNISLDSAISSAIKNQLSLQHEDGYWWYTLEANETICAEAIFLMHFMRGGSPINDQVQQGLARRIASKQAADGTWAIYWNGPSNLSTTIECYWALKVAGYDTQAEHMRKAREYILANGGLTHCRVFTKIHLAQFGLVPWPACPAMPLEFIFLPTWSPVNIYEFSSWARATIVPLLIIMNKKPVRPFPVINGKPFDLNELYVEQNTERSWQFESDKEFLSWERFFIKLDKFLKVVNKVPSPFEKMALKKCEDWISEHIERTEDIYPALAYGAMALSTLGHPNTHPPIKKALDALRNFQQSYSGDDLPAIATQKAGNIIHQQCCISPVWDTPWQLTALLDAGVSPDHPQLIKAGEWLLSKQINEAKGDWRIKNPDTAPGGWSFEFENDYFPDTDDTIQVLHVLNKLKLDPKIKEQSIKRGLNWLMSMQSKDGGWAAFDVNQDLTLVNRIPFSDHGACLDESCADITGRVLSLVSELKEVPQFKTKIERAIDFLISSQEDSGAWVGRWGINYIYGTWCAITGLSSISRVIASDSEAISRIISKGADFLRSIQHEDGGWSESPESYNSQKYEPYHTEAKGVPSQTAWALMGLIAAENICHCERSEAISRGINFLIDHLNADGTWNEKEYTGTGFPGHFYIRYHGYRYFFPLLALAKAASPKPVDTMKR